jgi:hypothetical protein
MASIVSAGTTSGTSLNLSADTSGVLQLATNGTTTAVTIDTSQNVGIGTTSPSYKLDVRGTTDTSYFQVLSTADANSTALRIGTDGTSAFINATGGSTGILQFRTYGTERMRIDSSGNVGIGTSSPSGKLQVEGSQNSEFQVRLRNSSSGSSARTVILLGNDANAGTAGIFLQSSTNTTAGGGANALTFYMGLGAPITFETSATERMRITSGGDLQFNSGYGSVATAYGCRAWVNFNGTGTVSIRASGNVSSITDNGIGAYRVNFTTNMPDSNYSIAGAMQRVTDPLTVNQFNFTASGFNVESMNYLQGLADSILVNLSVFR